jgi:hypothetical protein
MLMDYIMQAIRNGADSIEIEYQDGRTWIYEFWGNTGCSIGSLDSEARPIYDEINQLKKTKSAVVNSKPYRLLFSTYQSFGETVHRISFREGQPAAKKKAVKGKKPG